MTNHTPAPPLSRRQFMQALAAGAALGLPLALGYGAWRVSAGQAPPLSTPWHSPPDARRGRAPGAPVLALIHAQGGGRFAAYLPELLHAEGIAGLAVDLLAEGLTAEALRPYALVVLSAGPISTAQAAALEGYVRGGGRLVALRPGNALVALAGAEQVAQAIPQSAFTVDGERCPGWTPQATTQIHAAAEHYRAPAESVLAWLGGADDERRWPAVTLQTLGSGQLAIWSFDLVESIVLMRQGNPEWANQERDGREGIRAQDMFVDWIDLSLIEAPQADLQMRLFSRLIHEMLAERLPLPRLWYFPANASSVLVATGDSHAGPADSVEEALRLVEEHGGRMSVYYAPPIEQGARRLAVRAQGWMTDHAAAALPDSVEATLPTRQRVADWRRRGHEFGLHPYVEEGLEAGWDRYWRAFTGRGFGPVSLTTRTHAILWSGWTETARVQAGHGIRMNLDFYHYGPAFQRADSSWAAGYFTGSGLPMRFIDAEGRVLRIYQQVTQLVDEHLMQMPWGLGGPNGTVEEAVAASVDLLGRAVRDWPSAVAAQFHIDPFALGDELRLRQRTWMEGTLGFCAESGIPIVTAESLFHYTQVRNEATFSHLSWDANSGLLRFEADFRSLSSPAVERVGLLLPLRAGARTLDRIEADGADAPFAKRTLGGLEYAVAEIPARPGLIEALYAE